MTLEELTKAGFTEDQAKKILVMHQKSIDGNYIPKATFEAERQKVKDANATIAERDKQITELGSFKGTAEELQKKVDELTTANNTANASGGQATNDDYQTKEEDREKITLFGSDSVKTEAKTVSVNNAYLKGISTGTRTNTMKAGKVKVFARSVTGADTHNHLQR